MKLPDASKIPPLIQLFQWIADPGVTLSPPGGVKMVLKGQRQRQEQSFATSVR